MPKAASYALTTPATNPAIAKSRLILYQLTAASFYTILGSHH
ncbi:hypothetical protein [Nostoc sp. CALU 1950]